MEEFLTVLAWILGPVSTIFTIIKIIGFISYENDALQKVIDQHKGVGRCYSIRTVQSILEKSNND